ncbi:MAG: hypothetical protein AAGJ28_14700, partial [Pseudomonadota bacterium]
MTENVVRSIGPGRDFIDLASFARALPADLVEADQTWVAELYADLDDPGGAVFEAVCDATRRIVLRAATGQGFTDLMDAETDPLAFT